MNPSRPTPVRSARTRPYNIRLTTINRIPTIDTATRHSTKIHDFFGLPSSVSPTDMDLDFDIAPTDVDEPSEPRSSYNTARTISSKLKKHSPAIKLHTRRTKRGLSTFIQSCSPVW
jgi:hypothetical protein